MTQSSSINNQINNAIILYLNEVNQSDPLRYVSHNEVMGGAISRASVSISSLQFTSAISYLIGKGYIHEEAAHYRLTPIGRDRAQTILYPPPDLHKKSSRSQSIGNIIGAISVLIAAIGLCVNYPTILENFLGGYEKLYSAPVDFLYASADTDSGVIKSILSDWFGHVPPGKEFIYDDVRFFISENSPVIETESQGSSNPSQIIFPLDQIQNTRKIHLLINLSYTSRAYTGLFVEGLDIARVWIISGDKKYNWDLEVGSDLREWVIGGKGVIDSVKNHVSPIWEDNYKTSDIDAVIDHIVLEVPSEFQALPLDFLIIEDKSMDEINSENPGLMIFGITLEHLR